MMLIYLRSGCHRDGNWRRAQLHVLCLAAPRCLTCRKRYQAPTGVVHFEAVQNAPIAFTYLPLPLMGIMLATVCSVLEVYLMLVNYENCIVSKIIALELGA